MWCSSAATRARDVTPLHLARVPRMEHAGAGSSFPLTGSGPRGGPRGVWSPRSAPLPHRGDWPSRTDVGLLPRSCRLPPSWDRSEPFLATFMGPPGLPVAGPAACRTPWCRGATATDPFRSSDLEESSGVSGGGGDRDSGSCAAGWAGRGCTRRVSGRGWIARTAVPAGPRCGSPTAIPRGRRGSTSIRSAFRPCAFWDGPQQAWRRGSPRVNLHPRTGVDDDLAELAAVRVAV
jgi:hypothetical protein